MTAGREQDAREAAAAVSALIDAAVRDYRTVYPEPHALAPNLALAVQAQNVLRAFAALLPSPPATTGREACTACGTRWAGCINRERGRCCDVCEHPAAPSPPTTTGAGEAWLPRAVHTDQPITVEMVSMASPPATDGAGAAARIGEMHRAAVELDRLCEVMHDAYEAAAADAGWETQAASRKPWSDVPEANKVTMRIAVRALLAASSPPATDGDAAGRP